ncbi:MAG: HD domain-containing protein [Lachnospiraceae bacterium]|nr:HD domain-containing protein [Lachnospiraceae bacterium]
MAECEGGEPDRGGRTAGESETIMEEQIEKQKTLEDFRELISALKAAETVDELDRRREEIAGLIPKVREMFEYDQMHYAHQYDLWMHSLHVVLELPRGLDEDMLYLAALLHDIGKPDCQRKGDEGDPNMHYEGHPERSEWIVKTEILPDLERRGVFLSCEEKRKLLYYVRHHDDWVKPEEKYLREHFALGADFREFRFLMLLEAADALAHVQVPFVAKRLEICNALAGAEGQKLYEGIILQVD